LRFLRGGERPQVSGGPRPNSPQQFSLRRAVPPHYGSPRGAFSFLSPCFPLAMGLGLRFLPFSPNKTSPFLQPTARLSLPTLTASPPLLHILPRLCSWEAPIHLFSNSGSAAFPLSDYALTGFLFFFPPKHMALALFYPQPGQPG